jgi:hypothetical protein
MQNNDHHYMLRCAKLNNIKKKLIADLKIINEQLAAQSVVQGVSNQSNATSKVKQNPKKSIEAPVKMQHGLAHTGNAAEAQEDILKSYSDNPETEEQEIAKDASWQSVNSAVGNYMTQQVAKLAQSQYMA